MELGWLDAARHKFLAACISRELDGAQDRFLKSWVKCHFTGARWSTSSTGTWVKWGYACIPQELDGAQDRFLKSWVE